MISEKKCSKKYEYFKFNSKRKLNQKNMNILLIGTLTIGLISLYLGFLSGFANSISIYGFRKVTCMISMGAHELF